MIEKLACKLGRNDEVPNIELAEHLFQHQDTAGIREIAGGFTGVDKAVASDCIKVLYEIGERCPELISAYADDFISGLHSKNNRLVWGSMTALATIAECAPEPIYEQLPVILTAFEQGSAITVDNGVSVLAGLCKANDAYAKTILPVLLDHFRDCRPKDLPRYVERASVCFNKNNASAFIEVLEGRLPHLAAPGQARIKKLLKALRDL